MSYGGQDGYYRPTIICQHRSNIIYVFTENLKIQSAEGTILLVHVVLEDINLYVGGMVKQHPCEPTHTATMAWGGAN